ncbi:disease resistance protein RUN1-like isoform X1 [Syzygium oleosum]|uniref:disease resistance protein RUN1-like isoform X1 n=1 Tax=Syzygium oleosum TaxID=219896 RepID=UPI0024BAAB4A|nr:disease resistance protein RUN1-like isoform X1 [Syzygium oleosum]
MKRKEPTHSEDPICRGSSSSTSPHVGDYEGETKRPKGNYYEVFLSFRGEDTRKGFTDYLYTSLVEAGIYVFRDDNELRVGEEIGLELICSIKQSTILIPIISENYAFSKWCLRELALMLKCKRTKGQIVLPIFYKVKPSQVRHLTGRFEDAIKAHKENRDEMVLKDWKRALKEVKEWEEALKEVGSLKGWESEKIDNGHEGTLVKIVVRKVMGELKRLFQLNVPQQLVGIDDHVQQIMSKIDDEFNGTRIIGIYGMGGIGKTTLAKVLYNKLSSHFDYRSFVANIRETSQRKGIECIQKQLISAIIGSSCDVSNVDEGVSVIKSRFMSKKILVLLDDMDDSTHSNALVGDGSWFEAGSIVIITTRNKSILDEVRAGYMYKLNELSLDQSLILFTRHAFRKDSPSNDYEVISRDVVSTTGGLPLALEVIGSFLCGKREEVWRDTLKKLKKVPDKKVQEKLKISYEALDDEEQQIFLDIACFFNGSHKQNPTYMWDASSFLPGRGLEVLSLMSLIKIDKYGKLTIHDQLRDLGREIVRLENPKEPQERSRLWINEEAVDVINGNKGTRKIEALSLGEGGKERIYTAEQFKQMTNLRFLLVDGMNFAGDFQSLLPKLRWLQWAGCPSDFIATNFHPNKLVVLDLSNSAISKDWGGWVQLKMATELKVLNLGNCLSLRRTPDLTSFISLEILILECCVNLEEIHPSIGNIKTLVSLDVSYCKRLKKLPAGIGRMVKLRELRIKGTDIQEIPISRGCLTELETLCVGCCKRLSQLPKSVDSLVSLTLLDLSDSAIEELPESIGSMKKLETLNASECRLLARIPSSIGNLASLQSLFLRACFSLTEIPDSIGKLASLTELDLGSTSITKLPESIGNMPNLRILDISNSTIMELPDAIGKLAKLQRLGAGVCKKLERLPSNICELVSLEELSLDFSGISNLPKSISKLSSLQELSVEYCEKLREIPELPSGLTDLRIICQSPPLPHLSQLTRLTKLDLSNCPWLECVPELPIGLSQLNIVDFRKLKAFTNLSNLKHLSKLFLQYCFHLAEVTGLEGSHCLSNLPARQCPKISGVDGIEDSSKLMSPNASLLDGSLDLSDSKILQRMDAAASCANSAEIQDPGGSKSSQVSDILKCTSAGRLLDFSSFKYLRSLYVWNCYSVTEIQGLDGSESLKYLDIRRCSSLRSVDLSNIKNLRRFYSWNCVNLVEIRGLEGLGPLQIFSISGCPSLRQSPDLLRLNAVVTRW